MEYKLKADETYIILVIPHAVHAQQHGAKQDMERTSGNQSSTNGRNV